MTASGGIPYVTTGKSLASSERAPTKSSERQQAPRASPVFGEAWLTNGQLNMLMQFTGCQSRARYPLGDTPGRTFGKIRCDEFHNMRELQICE